MVYIEGILSFCYPFLGVGENPGVVFSLMWVLEDSFRAFYISWRDFKKIVSILSFFFFWLQKLVQQGKKLLRKDMGE